MGKKNEEIVKRQVVVIFFQNACDDYWSLNVSINEKDTTVFWERKPENELPKNEESIK